MNVELKRIAEKKLEQLGGDVCGVLVRKDGRLAAVDEHGRVQWLQGGQGAEPVAFGIFYEGVFQEHAWNRDAAEAIALEDYVGLEGVTVEPLYTHPQPAQQGSLPWFVHVYNSGYAAGHHDTVEGGFTPIHHSDKDTYHEDEVLEILEDLNVQASRDTQPAQQGGVPEGYVLVEKGITPTPVVEAGLECFRLLNQSGIADDRTVVLSVFQDMLLAAERLAPATPQPEGDGWVKCSERLPTEADDDFNGCVWARFEDGDIELMEAAEVEQTWDDDISITHWMPTGLKRPQPPREGKGDE